MAAVALTILLVILWLAFVALGYWHGGWRQVVLLAGMLLSYAVLSEWAAPNGRDLAAQFHWSLARATTAVGLLYLLGGTFVLGFLGSLALDRPLPLSERERQCGAAMGVLNGGLLLALALRTLRSYAYAAGGGKTLRTAALSRFLIEGVGYLLLAALVLGVLAVAARLARVGGRTRESLPVAAPASEQMVAPPPQPLRMGAPPVVPAPTPPLAPAPVYVAEPIIDWPSTPPPGTRVEPVAAARPIAAAAEPATKSPAAEPEAQPSIPTAPALPRRVEPPMWYPVAGLAAAPAVPPPVVLAPANQPATPPPGAPDAVISPPTDGVPPVVRELDVATRDAPPVADEKEIAARNTPPVVREVAVATDDLPLVAEAALAPSAERPPAVEGEAMNDPAPDPIPAVQMTPNAVTETAPIPAVAPPPLPPLPAGQSATPSEPAPPVANANPPGLSGRPTRDDDPAKAHAGFARVAVARQPVQRLERPPAPQPVPQPPGEPEPLQPPLPTGPRVHPCPTCGYPVRDHARYCPNCGSRQRP